MLAAAPDILAGAPHILAGADLRVQESSRAVLEAMRAHPQRPTSGRADIYAETSSVSIVRSRTLTEHSPRTMALQQSSNSSRARGIPDELLRDPEAYFRTVYLSNQVSVQRA